MKPTDSQMYLARNAEHFTETGRRVTVFTTSGGFLLTECKVDLNEDDNAVILVGMNPGGNDVLIDVGQIQAVCEEDVEDAGAGASSGNRQP